MNPELRQEVAALGLLGLGYPQELGGTPAPFALRNVMSTTMARRCGSGGLMAGLFSLNIGLPPGCRARCWTRSAGGVPTPRICGSTACGCRPASCSARKAAAPRKS